MEAKDWCFWADEASIIARDLPGNRKAPLLAKDAREMG
jgi:hypothetical protein